MKKARKKFAYIVLDYISAFVAWLMFSTARLQYFRGNESEQVLYFNNNFNYFAALFGIPLAWIVIYSILGYYQNIYRKSRIKEFGETLFSSIIGSIIIFFVLILDDPVDSYHSFYFLFFLLFIIHFSVTWPIRFIQTHITKQKIRKGKDGFNTLIIGSKTRAEELFLSLYANDSDHGYKYVGFTDFNVNKNSILSKYMRCFEKIDDLNSIIEQNNVEEVIIALEKENYSKLDSILLTLEKHHVIIKVIPSMYDLMRGQLSLSFFEGTPLMIVKQVPIDRISQIVKRSIDIGVSLLGILFLIPLYIVAYIGVKSTSKGAVIFKQERIGKHGIPFTIYKFRSMYSDAEKHGPQLSSSHDPRITPFGRFMRKYRLDEIPQFVNVLKGDMSLVGPRPERQYYIDAIMKFAPHYSRILQVRPGITSWGAVKYGYTENVEQMLEQLKYDIFYIENMSLYLDFKILLYTVGVVLARKGK